MSLCFVIYLGFCCFVEVSFLSNFVSLGAGVLGGNRSLAKELHIVVSCQIWLLGVELRFSHDTFSTTELSL